jgi:membrane-associated protease RseP (regulator of RpoE activity)
VIPGIAAQGSMEFGVPPLQYLLEAAIFPGVRPVDIYFHPIARGAWIGMFATAMNLLPIGQLDGGHILYSFFPSRHRLISKILCLALIPLGRLWPGWALWGVVLLWLGRHHPVVHDPSDLAGDRRVLAWIALAVFVVCFTFVPFRT